MPQPRKILLLPVDIRDELDRRLLAAAFGDIRGHVAWLRSRGHHISRSALGDYSMKHRERIRASRPQPPDLAESALRLRALDIATRISPAGGHFEAADALLSWAHKREK